MTIYSDYDPFAWVYNKHLVNDFAYEVSYFYFNCAIIESLEREKWNTRL